MSAGPSGSVGAGSKQRLQRYLEQGGGGSSHSQHHQEQEQQGGGRMAGGSGGQRGSYGQGASDISSGTSGSKKDAAKKRPADQARYTALKEFREKLGQIGLRRVLQTPAEDVLALFKGVRLRNSIQDELERMHNVS